MEAQKEFFRASLAAGVQDVEIAKRAGVSRAHVSRMRHGHSPMINAVRKLNFRS